MTLLSCIGECSTVRSLLHGRRRGEGGVARESGRLLRRGRGRLRGGGRRGALVRGPQGLLRRHPRASSSAPANADVGYGGGLESRLLDPLEQPGHPQLLFLVRGGHQQHFLCRGGVVVDLARGHALTVARGHVVFVELGATPCGK